MANVSMYYARLPSLPFMCEPCMCTLYSYRRVTSIHIAIIYFCVNSPPSSHIYFSILRVNFHVCAFELEKKKQNCHNTFSTDRFFSLHILHRKSVQELKKSVKKLGHFYLNPLAKEKKTQRGEEMSF